VELLKLILEKLVGADWSIAVVFLVAGVDLLALEEWRTDIPIFSHVL